MLLLISVYLGTFLPVAFGAQPYIGTEFGGELQLGNADHFDTMSGGPVVRRERRKPESGVESRIIDFNGNSHAETVIEMDQMDNLHATDSGHQEEAALYREVAAHHTRSGPIVSREQREKALRDTVNVLTAAGVEFVAGYGTVLGLFRDGRLVEQDDDVDFLVSDETFGLVRPALEAMRGDLHFKEQRGDLDYKEEEDSSWARWDQWRYFHHVSAPGWGPIELYRVRAVSADRAKNASEANLLCNDWDEVAIPMDELFPAKFFHPTGLPNLTVPMPNRVVQHIEHFYGTDWRTPIASTATGSKGVTDKYWSNESLAVFWRLCSPGRSTLTNHVAFTHRRLFVSLQCWSAGLLIPLAGAVWLAWKSLATDWNTGRARSVYDWGLAGMYCSLSAGATLALRQTKGTAVLLTIEACLLLYTLKALLSLGLLILKQSTSFGDIITVLRQKNSGGQYVWYHLALVGSLFAAYDALSFLAAQDIPPLSFQLLLHSRGLLVVPLQWCVLGKKINQYQLCALLFIGIGASSLGAGDVSALGSDMNYKQQHDYRVGMLLIVGKCVLSALALVVNEKLLKELPLTVDAQNLVTYIFGMSSMGAGILCWAFVTSNTVAVQQRTATLLGQLWINPWIFISVLLMAILGLVCAYLLKAFSAIEKEVLSVGVVALLAVGQSVTPGEHRFGVNTIECAFIIMLGCFTYRMNEATPKAQAEKPGERDS